MHIKNHDAYFVDPDEWIVAKVQYKPSKSGGEYADGYMEVMGLSQEQAKQIATIRNSTAPLGTRYGAINRKAWENHFGPRRLVNPPDDDVLIGKGRI